MTAINSSYISLLKEKRIVYMPTCLIIEKMTRLYGRISKIRSHDDLVSQLGDMIFHLRYFKYELHCTSKAYEEMRLMFFIGDWKDDRIRARKIFINLLERLAYFSAYVEDEKREELLELIEELDREWSMLVRILDEKSSCTQTRQSANTCRYFRSVNPESWQLVMARAVLMMYALEECRDPDTYLLVLCYPRVRQQILREVEALENKNRSASKFHAEKIVCASDEDSKVSCPICMTMTGDACHLDGRRGARSGVDSGQTLRRSRDTHVSAIRPTLRVMASRGRM